MRLFSQVLVILGLAWVMAFSFNAGRGVRLPWSGSDPDELRWPDLEWISASDAAAYQDDVTTLFLDARPKNDYDKRHVIGAVSFPADDVEGAYMEFRDFFDPQMTFIIYADEPNLSSRVFKFLQERNYSTLIIKGGWDAWERERLPVERGSG